MIDAVASDSGASAVRSRLVGWSTAQKRFSYALLTNRINQSRTMAPTTDSTRRPSKL